MRISGTILIIGCLQLSSSHAATFVNLTSDTGDWIGHGATFNLSETNGTFAISSISANSITFKFNSSTTGDYFDFQFAPPNISDLKKDAFLAAERLAFKGPLAPGMDISTTGRGCNTISGEFYIYEMDTAANPPKLAMDFIQYCDSTTAALHGEIRINSDIPTPYPLPVAISDKKYIVTDENQTISLNATQSFSKTDSISGYHWLQLSGPTATILNENNQQTDIVLPNDVALGGEDIALQLIVTDSLQQQDTTEIHVKVHSKSDPKTFFTMHSQQGDYIGAGLDWNYDLQNATFGINKNSDNGVSVSINGSTWWYADFAAPDNVLLTPGSYDYAERYPFQSTGVAGLSIDGDGRGCNNLYGNFNVTQLTWVNNLPARFRATFEQHCEIATAPALTGEIAVNALDPSVPVADAGADISAYENTIVKLNGSGSYDNLGNLVSYQWSSESPDIQLSNGDTSQPYFTAPPLPDNALQKVYTIQLLVSDNDGFKAADTMNVTVLSGSSSNSGGGLLNRLTLLTLLVSVLSRVKRNRGLLLTRLKDD